MDKVRKFLGVVWQQRFWVLVALGALLAVACWAVASGNLQKQFAANVSAIKGHHSSMDKLTGAPVHGNPDVNQKELAGAREVRNQVLRLWQGLYDHQREKVLTWPAVLGDEFLAYVAQKRFLQDISDPDLRDVYWTYIKNRFDALVDIVHAKKMAETDAAMGMGMGGGGEYGRGGGGFEGGGRGAMGGGDLSGLLADGQSPYEQEQDYLVQWLDQAAVRQKLTFPNRPSSLQIWVTQENLWVYETLLQVIANANEARGATRPDNAAIRAILALQLGAEAALASRMGGNIIMPAGAEGAEGGFGEPGMGPPGGMGMEGGRPGMGGPGGGYGEGGMEGGMGMRGGYGEQGGNADALLLTNRYLDATGQPVAATPESPPEELGVEFRRLPVRMQLLMDERWIPTVLVECANAALPIEITCLRVNAEKSGVGFEGAAGGGRYGGEGMGMGRGGGGGGMTDLGTSLPAGLATVEFQGVVYIYNPPKNEALAIPGDAAEEGADVAESQPAAVVR
jgi:hypothetical protein